MPFYPILNAPDCEGWVTLSNFPPNDWQGLSRHKTKKIYATWSDGEIWNYTNIGNLEPYNFKTLKASDIRSYINCNQQIFLFLTDSFNTDIFVNSKELTEPIIDKYSTPEWRATLGLSTLISQTSYQGEINIFPQNASLLSLSPMHQSSSKIKNYLLFVNLEKSAKKRDSVINIHSRINLNLKKKITVYNNTVNIIDLSDILLSEGDFIIVSSKTMTGVPLFFSKSLDEKYMSLEHTHPPASYGVHGRRSDLQKFIKKIWFKRI